MPLGTARTPNGFVRINFGSGGTDMLTKILKAGIAGSLLLASAAYAAENSTTATSDKPAAATSDKASMTDESFKGDWRASKVVGLNVYNAQNENVGSINDLLMDKSGNIKAAVISVGGFLGMGARLVAVPFDKMKFSTEPVAYTGTSSAAPGAGGAKPPSTTTTGSTSGTSPATASKPNPWYPDHAVFDATKDQLKTMPEFKYSTE
jgi:sporulation protein YlmC with PRC-barrel domain